MQKKLLYCLLAAISLLPYCKDPYNPALSSANVNYLVVDGTIVGGSGGQTRFVISHTVPMDQGGNGPNIDAGATVNVEGEDGSNFPLSFDGQAYAATSLPLKAGSNYRLHVVSQQKEYVSDYVPYKISPPIDSVSWGRKGDGLQLYISTHDPNNDSRYYRWRYNEVWEYHSEFESTLKYDTLSPDFDPSHPSLVGRPYPEIMALFRCWHSGSTENILVGTSSQLSADVVDKFAFFYIGPDDRRLDVLYSTTVTQTVLTAQAYAYWINVRKITEQIGDIFGPLPSEVRGNVHNVKDAGEIVVGFVSASSATSQRVFVPRPDFWKQHSGSCTQDSIKLVGPGLPAPWVTLTATFADGNYYPLFWADPLQTVVMGADGTCVNCTLQGGSNVKPDFWPN